MLFATYQDGTTFNSRSWTPQHHSSGNHTSHPQPDGLPDVTDATGPAPKFLTEDRLQILLQMQKTDPFCNEYPNASLMEKH